MANLALSTSRITARGIIYPARSTSSTAHSALASLIPDFNLSRAQTVAKIIRSARCGGAVLVIGICGVGKSESLGPAVLDEVCYFDHAFPGERFNVAAEADYLALKSGLGHRILMLDEVHTILTQAEGYRALRGFIRHNIPVILITYYAYLPSFVQAAKRRVLPEMPLIEFRPLNRDECYRAASRFAREHNLPQPVFERLWPCLFEISGGFYRILNFCILAAKAYSDYNPNIRAEEFKNIIHQRIREGKNMFPYLAEFGEMHFTFARHRLIGQPLPERTFWTLPDREQQLIIKLLRYGWLKIENGNIALNSLYIYWLFEQYFRSLAV